MLLADPALPNLIRVFEEGDFAVLRTILVGQSREIRQNTIKVRDDELLGALNCAIKLGRLDMIEVLLFEANPDDLSSPHCNALFHAVEAEAETVKIISLLLKYDVRVGARNGQKKTALRVAAEKNKLEAVQELIELDDTALLDAVGDCERSHEAQSIPVMTVQRLLNCGANSDPHSLVSWEGPVLHVAAQKGCLPVFHLFRNNAELPKKKKNR